MSNLHCYINKQFLPIEKAGVSVTDLLVQRGYGIFDYLRVADNKPLFLEDHLERFYNSANMMRLQVKETKEFGDMNVILDVEMWMLQLVIPYAFFSMTLRHLYYVYKLPQKTERSLH